MCFRLAVRNANCADAGKNRIELLRDRYAERVRRGYNDPRDSSPKGFLFEKIEHDSFLLFI